MSRWPEWMCPQHGVVLVDEEDSLVCSTGHVVVKVYGIPRFVGSRTYADAFGAQWLRYRRTQLDSYTKTTISRDRARRCLGETLWNSLSDALVLECGCGAGRFTEILLERGARVVSVDLSSAVDANQENFPQDESHRVAQADILELPFRPRGFDVVFCLGVIQHTPSPEQTIGALYEHVRPGGALVIDHYLRTWTWYVQSASLLRFYFRRLPPEVGIEKTQRLVERFLPLLRRLGRSSRPRLYTRVVKPFVPVSSYYHVFPQLSDDHQEEWAKLDTHDFLTDRYKHLRSVGEIRRTLERLGLEDIVCRVGGNGVEARGRRPR